MSDLELFLNLSVIIVMLVYFVQQVFIMIANFEREDRIIKYGTRAWVAYQQALAETFQYPESTLYVKENKD